MNEVRLKGTIVVRARRSPCINDRCVLTVEFEQPGYALPGKINCGAEGAALCAAACALPTGAAVEIRGALKVFAKQAFIEADEIVSVPAVKNETAA